MKTLSIKLTKSEMQTLKQKYSHFPIRYDIQYTEFQIKGTDVTITAYTSGKVVFQGEGAEFHAKPYLNDTATVAIHRDKPSSSKPQHVFPMAGSDEVGTGDYFGPVVVCAAIISEEDLKNIPVERIVDSKQLQDDVVRDLAPILRNTLKYSLLILDNPKYNRVHRQKNMNEIKAMLHNQAYVNLKKQGELPETIIIDQFVSEKRYYQILKDEPQVIQNIHFETKAENKFLAVACGAIIARDAFLDYFDKLSAKYEMVFPKGAGTHVDIFGTEFVQRFGEEELYKVAKVHFANTTKITGRELE